MARQFYERVASAPSVPPGLPLVIALTGFTDAGSAVSSVVQVFRDDLDPAPIALFSADTLLDYRARRPIVSFEADHLTDYRPPRLELSLAHDALGEIIDAGGNRNQVVHAFAIRYEAGSRPSATSASIKQSKRDILSVYTAACARPPRRSSRRDEMQSRAMVLKTG